MADGVVGCMRNRRQAKKFSVSSFQFSVELMNTEVRLPGLGGYVECGIQSERSRGESRKG
jgi:hypothetical protein